MTSDADRLARASQYVQGLMDETERERAERDLELDGAFRTAVVTVAEQMHLFDAAATSPPNDGWRSVAAGLSELPHMRTVVPPTHASAASHRPRNRIGGDGDQAAHRRLTLMIMAGIIVAFVAGYATGLWSARLP